LFLSLVLIFSILDFGGGGSSSSVRGNTEKIGTGQKKQKESNSSSHETCQHRISLTTISTQTFQFLETSSFFFFSKREKLVARRWMTRVCKTSSMKSRPMTSIASREFEMNAQSIV
jgi:hypothetical protein